MGLKPFKEDAGQTFASWVWDEDVILFYLAQVQRLQEFLLG